jgi:hypothetical protein
MSRLHELAPVASRRSRSPREPRLDASGTTAPRAPRPVVRSDVTFPVALVVRPPGRVLVARGAVAEATELRTATTARTGSGAHLRATPTCARGDRARSRYVACCEERTTPPRLPAPALACEACWRGAPGRGLQRGVRAARLPDRPLRCRRLRTLDAEESHERPVAGARGPGAARLAKTASRRPFGASTLTAVPG